MLTLYASPLSANGRKVLAVSHQLGLEADIRLVNVYRGEGRSPEYLAINPWGKIPTLRDGDLTLYESNAILQYLSEAHGGFRLWSRDPKARARISRWLFWESAHWQPVLTTILAPWVGHRLSPDVLARPETDPNWDTRELRTLLRAVGLTLYASPFLTGEEVTLADFAVAGMATYFRSAQFPFEDHPAFMEWYFRMEALEGWRATQEPVWYAPCSADFHNI